MDEDRIAGAAQQARGVAKESSGNLLGDTRLQVEGAAERAAGTVRGAAARAAEEADSAQRPESPEAEVMQLRAEVDGIAVENAATQARVEHAVRRADAAVDRRTDAVAEVVRDHPLLAIGSAALAGFLFARLTASTTTIHRR